MSHSRFTKFTKQLRMVTVLSMIAALFAPLAQTTTSTFAAVSVTEAKFSGGTGTTLVSSMLFAKKDATLTLTVKTTEARCVRISGAFTAEQTAASAQDQWTFSTTAPAGDGVQAVTVFAAKGNNGNEACNGQNVSTHASYTLDNTGPVTSASMTSAEATPPR